MNRLITFQNSCMESASSEPHKIDRWMIKFLLQHAVILDNRQTLESGAVHFDSIADSHDATNNQELLERSLVTEQIIRDAQAASGNTRELGH
jgi:hypothetical protein